MSTAKGTRWYRVFVFTEESGPIEYKVGVQNPPEDERAALLEASFRAAHRHFGRPVSFIVKDEAPRTLDGHGGLVFRGTFHALDGRMLCPGACEAIAVQRGRHVKKIYRSHLVEESPVFFRIQLSAGEAEPKDFKIAAWSAREALDAAVRRMYGSRAEFAPYFVDDRIPARLLVQGAAIDGADVFSMHLLARIERIDGERIEWGPRAIGLADVARLCNTEVSILRRDSTKTQRPASETEQWSESEAEESIFPESSAIMFPK